MTTATSPPGLSFVGHAVFDGDGAELGEVVGVYLDHRSGQPEWAALRRLSGGGISVVPLTGASIYEDSIDVPFTTKQVEEAPYRRTRLARELSEAEEAVLYRHYGQSTAAAGAVTTARPEAASAPGFARRRPGIFLLAAAALGFAAGRALRAARAGGVGEALGEDTAERDELDAPALDALSARLWPGDVADG